MSKWVNPWCSLCCIPFEDADDLVVVGDMYSPNRVMTYQEIDCLNARIEDKIDALPWLHNIGPFWTDCIYAPTGSNTPPEDDDSRALHHGCSLIVRGPNLEHTNGLGSTEASDKMIKIMRYDPSSIPSRSQLQWYLRRFYRLFDASVSGAYGLPLEISRHVVGGCFVHFMLSYGALNTDPATSLYSDDDDEYHVNPREDMWARLVKFAGQPYVNALSNEPFPPGAVVKKIQRPDAFKAVHLLRDHLGIRDVVFGEREPPETPKMADHIVVWWTTSLIARQEKTLEVETDGLKLRFVRPPSVKRGLKRRR